MNKAKQGGSEVEESGSVKEDEKEETIKLNSKFERTDSWMDACYAISPNGDIELLSAGDSMKAEDSAYPIITTDEVLKLAEIVKTNTEDEDENEDENEDEKGKRIKNIGEIADFLDDVSKRYKEYLHLEESFYQTGSRAITVSAITLSKEARDEITAFFDLPLRLKRKTGEEGVLRAEGVKDYGVNTQLKITLWDAEKCKKIGTKKKVIKKEVEITPAVYETVEEEIEVPIYECPNGRMIEG